MTQCVEKLEADGDLSLFEKPRMAKNRTKREERREDD